MITNIDEIIKNSIEYKSACDDFEHEKARLFSVKAPRNDRISSLIKLDIAVKKSKESLFNSVEHLMPTPNKEELNEQRK